MKLTTIAVLTSLAVMTAACVQTDNSSAAIERAEEQPVMLSELLTTEAPEGQLHAFAAPSHRMAGGFEQVTLEELSANPRAYFRNEQSYAAFKRSFEIHLNKQMDDQAFVALLSSDRVEVRACDVSSIRTAGIDDLGRIGWINRACEEGENLIYVKVGQEWVSVAAMGCLNPLDSLVIRPKWLPLESDPGITPPEPPEPPETPKPDIVRPGLGPDTTYEEAREAFYDRPDGEANNTSRENNNPWR